MLTAKSQCWICELPVWHAAVGVCYWCEQTLLMPIARCATCGIPLLEHTLSRKTCQQRTFPWDSLLTVGSYQPPLSKLLHQLKFARRTAHATTLARLILLHYLSLRRQASWPKPDAIVAVPLHRQRLYQRGFNQSELLAQPLARWLGCDYLVDAVTRIKATPAQHQLSLGDRQHNLHQAFHCTTDLTGRHLVLVDDVVTSGFTASAVTMHLKQQGAASVQIWCLCRTL